MSGTLDFVPGIPVDIHRIDHALNRLWEESTETKSRASLINFAIYTESFQSVAENTKLVEQVTKEHACRTLLIFADPSVKETGAEAWISAHCHLSGKSTHQVCSEQITFKLTGDVTRSLPNIVFSHLDSDLPLCFWWQGHFHDTAGAELWNWVDRLIFDSRCWNNPPIQFSRLRGIHKTTGLRMVLCDLNWTRLLTARFAIAQFFDHPLALPHLARLQKVTIIHDPAYHTTALLLMGWLASQLHWTPEKKSNQHSPFLFRSPEGQIIAVDLAKAPGAPVGCCRFVSDSAIFELRRELGSEFFQAHSHISDQKEMIATLNAGRDQILDLLLIELARGGKHLLYLKAIALVESLLTSPE